MNIDTPLEGGGAGDGDGDGVGTNEYVKASGKCCTRIERQETLTYNANCQDKKIRICTYLK